ncbi:MAG: DUF928 domain-containing protein [Leptolyngbyaceae cyanobacterium]
MLWLKRLLLGTLAVPLLNVTLILGINSPAVAQNGVVARLRSLFGGDQVEGQAAGRSRGGAVRGETCNTFHQIRPDALAHDHLMALMPQTNEGKTIARYPTFWFYLPLDASSEAIRAEFWLLDENDNSVLSNDIWLSLPEQPGIFSVTLPTSEAPLEVNKRYRWFFIIVCDESDSAGNPTVEGWIERVERDTIVQQLGGVIDAPPENLLSIYTEYFLWHETVSLLANHRVTRPELWLEFLDLFGLGVIEPGFVATEGEAALVVEPLTPLD